MNNDRELLELAAKAAGIGLDWTKADGYGGPFNMNSKGLPVWNPLTDDGDALRLAVKLSMDVDCCDKSVYVSVKSLPDGAIEICDCGDIDTKKPAPSEPESLEDWLANTPEAPAEAPDRHEWKPAPSVEPVACGNCFEGKSDMDHVCPKCGGAGVEPVAWAIYISGEPSDVFMHKQYAELECARRDKLYPDPTRQFVPLYTSQPDTAAQITELANEKRDIAKQRDDLWKDNLMFIDRVASLARKLDVARSALTQIAALENTEENEWHAVEVVIPKMSGIARGTLEAIK